MWAMWVYADADWMIEIKPSSENKLVFMIFLLPNFYSTRLRSGLTLYQAPPL